MDAEFKVSRATNTHLEVEEAAEGHVWTFTFAEVVPREWAILKANQLTHDHVRADALSGHAWRFAEGWLLKSGKIVRSTAP